MSWTIRDMKPDDAPFVVPYWRAGYEHAPEVQHSDRGWYRVEMSKRIAHCLEAGVTRVACLADDEDAILGFACTSRDRETLHYIAVRKEARDEGVAKSLLAELDGLRFYSHRPYKVPRFLHRLVYRPFIAPEEYAA